MKALGFNQLKVHPLSKVLVSDDDCQRTRCTVPYNTEAALLADLRTRVLSYTADLRAAAQCVAETDCLVALARCAATYGEDEVYNMD